MLWTKQKLSNHHNVVTYCVSTSKNISFITLKFFVPYHGQSEGDSAHSAISSALNTVGRVYVPSKQKSVIRLARRKSPYTVHSMENTDFLDFMRQAKRLRILSVRHDDNGAPLNWPSMTEYMVLKMEPRKIFFKSSHLSSEYRSLTLPRSDIAPTDKPKKLYKKNEPKISKEHFEEFIGMCNGETPIISGDENVLFYKHLRHVV